MNITKNNKIPYFITSIVLVVLLQGCLQGMGGGAMGVLKGGVGNLISGEYKNKSAYVTYKIVTQIINKSSDTAQSSIREFLQVTDTVESNKKKASKQGENVDMLESSLSNDVGSKTHKKITTKEIENISKIDYSKLNKAQKDVFKGAMSKGWEAFFYQAMATKGALHMTTLLSSVTGATQEIKNAVAQGVKKEELTSLPSTVKDYVSNIKSFGEMLEHFSTVDGLSDVIEEIQKAAKAKVDSTNKDFMNAFNEPSQPADTVKESSSSPTSSSFSLPSLGSFGSK
jgi:hypothetical protein